MNLKLPVKKKVVKTSSIPTKRSINFVTVGQEEINPKYATIGIVLIIIVAILFSKFLVVDRLMALSKAQSEVASIQSQVDAAYEKIESYEEISSEYAHYSYSGMTVDELELVDRGAIMDLIKNDVMPTASVTKWNLNGNELSLELSGASLSAVNNLASKLEEKSIVSYCSVQTASKSNSTDATLTIYLEKGGDDNENS